MYDLIKEDKELFDGGISQFKTEVTILAEKLEPYLAKAYRNHLLQENTDQNELIPVKSK